MENGSNLNINWFPGHMTKSLREMEVSLPLADVILYVLDARAPLSCRNPVFDDMIVNKPVVYLLNKSDLVPATAVTAWKNRFTALDKVAVPLMGTASGAAKVILPVIKKLAAAKIVKYQNKGVRAALRGMVIGVPNSGKSTIVNNFCGKAKAVTGNRPGVTRGKQWVRVNEFFELLDTPGTLYPKLSDQAVARRLAYIGSIKDEVTDTVALAKAFIEDISVLDADCLNARYGIGYQADSAETLFKIAQARGMRIRGGEVDTDKAAVAVLDDFRKGRLGKFCLDDINAYEKK